MKETIQVGKIPSAKRMALSIVSENGSVITPIAYFMKDEYADRFIKICNKMLLGE